MEPEEFAFIYQDLKLQLKEIPSLPLLLKSVEKTTKKLECLNLYSLVDRREFDFQLFEQNTFDEIAALVHDVATLKHKSQESSVNMQQLMELQQRIETIKQKKMQAFDKLSKVEQSVQEDIDNLIDETTFDAPVHLDNQIKQVEEDQEEQPEDQILSENHPEDRIQQLKKEIDQLNTKIVKINRGKGRWFDGDHNDFLKLYNRCRGQAEKIVEEGVKVLGMKNIEIMDHLQLYQNYLQLQKEKKLATEEFKSIKMLQQETKSELATQSHMIKLQKQKEKSKIKEEENIIKKIQVEEFRRKKAEEHQKLINQMSKERQNQKKAQKISTEKKKEIQLRNLKLIEEQKQKYKMRNSSKGITGSKEKPKPSSILSHKQANNLKLKLPKPSVPLPETKNILK